MSSQHEDNPTQQTQTGEPAKQPAYSEPYQQPPANSAKQRAQGYPPALAKPEFTPYGQPAKEKKGSFASGFGAGFGFSIGAGVIAVVLSLISALAMAGLGSALGSIASGATMDTTETIWGADNAKNKMLAINISGVIQADGGDAFTQATYGYEVAKQIDSLDGDEYKGLVLLMDTPGGSITGARAISDAVVRYQERTGHKVSAFVQSMSASGGMFAMAPADLIIADYGTMTGSIGVIMGPLSYYKDVTAITGNILSSGVEAGEIKQEYLTQGRGKDFGNPFREITDEERANYTHNIEVEYNNFVNYVAEHRNLEPDFIVNTLGAFMFDAETAVEKGLVDSVAHRDDAFKQAAELNDLDASDTKIVANTVPSEFARLFGAENRVYGHNVPMSLNDGKTATTSVCVGAPSVLAYAGDIQSVCGK